VLGCLVLNYTRFFFVGRGILSFFAGGLSFMLFAYVQKRRLASRFFVIAAMVLVVGGIAAFLANESLAYDLYRHFLGTRCVLFGHDVIGFALLKLNTVSFRIPLALLGYPILIISLALIETSRGTLGKRLAFLGDMSYSTYLLHFPLQVVIVSFALYFQMDWSRFYAPGGMLLFLAVLLPLCWLSYHRFEKPAQSFLRKRMGTAKTGANATASRQRQEAGVENES